MRTKELLALGIFKSGSHLGDRIEVLLKSGRNFSTQASAARVAVTTLVLLTLVIASSLAPRWIAFAQARPAFEVASVKPTSPGFNPDRAAPRPRDGLLPQQLNSGTLNYYGITVIDYIEAAYGLKDYQLSGPRPKDLFERYDIAARASGPATDQQMKLMLQTPIQAQGASRNQGASRLCFDRGEEWTEVQPCSG